MAIYARKVSIMLVQKFSDKDPNGKDIPGTLCDLGIDALGKALKCYWKGMIKASGVNGTGPKIVSFQLLAGPDSKSGGVKWDVLVKFLEKAARGEIVKDVFVVGEISSFNGNLSVSQIADVKSLDEIKVKFVEVWEGVKKEGGGSGKVSDSDYVLSIVDKLETEKNLLKLKVYESELATRIAVVIEKAKQSIEGSDEKKAFTATYKTLKLCLTQVEGKIKELGVVDDDDGNLPF